MIQELVDGSLKTYADGIARALQKGTESGPDDGHTGRDGEGCRPKARKSAQRTKPYKER
jgi:hypothetical protein